MGMAFFVTTFAGNDETSIRAQPHSLPLRSWERPCETFHHQDVGVAPVSHATEVRASRRDGVNKRGYSTAVRATEQGTLAVAGRARKQKCGYSR